MTDDSQSRECLNAARDDEEKNEEKYSPSVSHSLGRTSTHGRSASYVAMAINRCVILEGTDNEMICCAYRETILRAILFYFLVFTTLGLILLIFYWKPEWKVRLKSSPCDVEFATNVILYDHYKQKHVRRIQRMTVESKYLNCDSNDNISTGGLKRFGKDSSKPYLSLSKITKQGLHSTMFFEHKFQKFLWSGDTFLPLRGLDSDATVHDLQNNVDGLCETEKPMRRTLFGWNSIAIDITPIITLLFREILHPFYIFQVFAMGIWIADGYFALPGVILASSAVSICLSLYLTRKQNRMIHKMSSGSGPVRVLVNGNIETRDSTELLPGDVIEINAEQATLWCDCVVLTGSCAVSESMLTGESVPVLKSRLEGEDPLNEYFDPSRHKQHTLYGGTKIVDVYLHHGRELPRAVVIRTGFHTEKGRMIESMLSPSPLDYTFYNDSLKFIGVMALLGVFGCVLTITFLAKLGADAVLIVWRVLDLLTIVVPPGLPASITIATIYAQRRLRLAQIFCISPPRISISGKINCMCFDKTGTLTENEMKLWGIVPCSGDPADAPTNDAGKPTFQEIVHDCTRIARQGNSGVECFYCLASCHSLVDVNGEIVGDPIDIQLFKSTNWKMRKSEEEWCVGCKFALSQDDDAELKLAQARVYQFNSEMRRMSVVVKIKGDERLHVYAKGAPETIVEQCKQSTVPDNFEDTLLSYTQQGYRVLALATKNFEATKSVDEIERSFVESNLQFLGLVVLKNPLKPSTSDTILKLKAAHIRNVMATGDNLETAVHVAKECKMIGPSDSIVLVKAEPSSSTKRVTLSWEPLDNGDDNTIISTETSFSSMAPIVESHPNPTCHLAMSGNTLELIRTHSKDLYNRVLMSATVLARMKPQHKRHLVEGLQETKYVVGMCGDGANDSGALKAAHSGIAIAEIEASIVAPFTSMKKDISCCIKLIREGRAALVTSFGMMKFLCMYCFVQYLSLLFLYTINSYLSDIQFLFGDLGVAGLVTLFFAIGSASKVLYPKLPHISIVSPAMISCLFLQILAVVLIQMASFLALQKQSWYTPPVRNVTQREPNIVGDETTVLFYTSCFQYMILAFVFYEAQPHKEPVYKNVPYFVGFILLSIFVLVIFFAPFEPLMTWFSLTTLNYDVAFKFILLFFYLINIIFAVCVEKFLLQSKTYERLLNKVQYKLSTMRRNAVDLDEYQDSSNHVDLQRKFAQDVTWPPVGQKTTIRA